MSESAGLGGTSRTALATGGDDASWEAIRAGRESQWQAVSAPGSELGAHQLRELAALVAPGDGEVRLRGDGRLRLRLGHPVLGYGLSARLEAVGLAIEDESRGRVDRVLTHATAGIDADELTDVRPLARACADILRYEVPRCQRGDGVSAYIDGRAHASARCWQHDLGFLALGGSEPGFAWIVGGRLQPSPRPGRLVPVRLGPTGPAAVLRQVLRLAADGGEADPGREVSDPGRLLRRLSLDELVRRVEHGLGARLLPLEPGMVSSQPVEPERTGWFAQRQAGLCAVCVQPLLGKLRGFQLEGLAALSEGHGNGAARLGMGRLLLLCDVPAGRVGAVDTVLEVLGLRSWVPADGPPGLGAAPPLTRAG